MCLTTVTDRIIPPNYQESAVCSFIAATNIENISNYDEWSCTSDGVTSTDPCSPAWSGVACSGSSIVDLRLVNIGVSGMICLVNRYALAVVHSTSIYRCFEFGL